MLKGELISETTSDVELYVMLCQSQNSGKISVSYTGLTNIIWGKNILMQEESLPFR